MKKFLHVGFLFISISCFSQISDNESIKKEVIRLMDSINSSNSKKEIENKLFADKIKADKEQTEKESWYKKLSIRGYVQTRYNGLFSSNDKVSCSQCDRSWGTTSNSKSNNGFFIRRARIIFSGQVHPNLYVYIQPDFASSPSNGVNNFVQFRDAYADVSFDKKNEFRVRIGQSKVPFGFENLQSSQNRLTLDRNDGFNSAVVNERDLGAFFYWAPAKIRDRFAMLVKDGYKGSGDYGVFAFGAYNGQTANKSEANRNLHVVTRVTYPFLIGNQIIEPGIQAYTGKWAFTNELSTSVKTKDNLGQAITIPEILTPNKLNTVDQRLGATFVLYPKPFGIQAEYNIGKGPRFDKNTYRVNPSSLEGGYITLNYKYDFNKTKQHFLYPFAKFQYFDGGKKFEKDARSYVVRDYEIGFEWQPNKAFEIVAEWVISDRRFEDSEFINNRQKGNLLRLQAQFNF